MQIENHRIVDVPFRQAAGCGGSLKPTLACIHDTAGSLTKGNVVNYFAGAGCNVSAHFVVERDGSVTQMVPLNVRAWHADPSNWDGKAGCNWRAIGIEIVNPGATLQRHGQECLLIYPGNRIVGRWPIKDCVSFESEAHGGKGWCLPYTPEQITTVKEICRALVEAYPIKEIVGHYHVAPRRKVDPNPLFPFDEVRAHAFGNGEPAAEEPPPVMPDESAVASQSGWLAETSFAKVNALSDQGSRLATMIRRIKNWWWGGVATAGTAATLVDTKKGSANVIVEMVREHPFITVAVVGVVLGLAIYFGIKLVERYLITAFRDGRYRPKGG